MAVVLIRAVILYVVITFSLRLMGKRQLGELQPSELVVTILISNIAAIPVEDSSMPMIMGVVPILTLVCLDVIMSGIMLKSAKFRKLMIGSPRVIISEGMILQREMRRLRYTVDDLVEAMREQQDVSCGGSTENPPSVIIRDGIMDNEQLGLLGLGMGWLKQQLRENAVSEKDVFLMVADKNGKNTIIKRQEGM